jgi:hypothetical protein
MFPQQLFGMYSLASHSCTRHGRQNRIHTNRVKDHGDMSVTGSRIIGDLTLPESLQLEGSSSLRPYSWLQSGRSQDQVLCKPL